MTTEFKSVFVGCPDQKFSSMIECSIMVRCVIRSVSHGGPTKLFLVPASAPQLVLSCLWNGAY